MTIAPANPTSVDDPSRTRSLLVTQLTLEATSTLTLRLADPDGADLPAWRPGAHIDVILPSGLIRQYSLCGDPDDLRSYRIGVLRDPRSRGGSEEIHNTVLLGRRLDVRGPRNNFALVDAPGYVFVAGGIGITPMVPMIREAVRRGVPWQLFYGARSRDYMPFRAELAELAGPGSGVVHLVPQDECGLLDLDRALAAAAPGIVVYCCGPEAMLAAAQRAGAAANPAREVRIERFSAPAAESADPTAAPGTSFEVELRRSGMVLQIPADRGLLEVIRESVPGVPYSCEGGYCGACETRVLEGTPEHHDLILGDDAQQAGDTMMICVGRSSSERLVLDL
ncbi:oxidoreductase [Dactylosporangium roseum]|uniref:Oxidoreductase n=1 Tax=Dactylosporangium roseum TaxID=47989 RepID=A0ABY5YYU1_9ACTN|nr:PDR/VanB family oxidoreductase [Dactylosporangium roseum]UWZ34561.1 oxidoreductase [Dactylosporangium roseum]